MDCSENSVIQYGTSSSACDYIISHQISELNPSTIVDFGAGAGKNAKIARSVLLGSPTIYAVEGCNNTASMLLNSSLYDQVFCELIQNWILKCNKKYDLAIFGDVLEHLKSSEIRSVLKISLKKFKHIIIVCPLHDLFQDDSYGNSLEVHRTYITSYFFDKYNVLNKHIVKNADWTIMNVCISSNDVLPVPVWRKFFLTLFHWIIVILQPIGLAKPFVNFLKRFAIKYKWLIRD